MNHFNFRKVLIICTLLLTVSITQAQQFLTQINGWNAYVHLPASYNSTNNYYPTIVFFPGWENVGTNAQKVIVAGPGAYIAQGWDGNVVVNGNTVEFIVISLQPSSAFPTEALMNQRFQTLKNNYRIDPNRLFLTGVSHGGWCGSTFVTGDRQGGPYTYANQIAAVVNYAGVKPDDNSPYPALFDNFAISGGRYLGIEQKYDGRDIRTIVNRMNNTKPNSAIYVQSNFGNGGHCCPDPVFGGNGTNPSNFNIDGATQNIYQWLAKQSKGSTPANIPPVANAGPDRNITLPVNSASLSGSGTDADGNIASYQWTKISGPSGTINNANSANATAVSLVAGTYQFQLRVTDNAGASSTDNMTVIVNPAAQNQAPVANAGADQSITLPTNSVNLTGSGSDPDGSIVSYQWTKTSGPAATINNATSANATATSLVAGTYQFQLRVTDNGGASSTDNITVVVNPGAPGNQPPVASAGTDQTILLPANSASLSGTGSDGDGTISSYAWSKESGPAQGTITSAGSATTTVTNLVAGTYIFRLTVTDDDGATDTDDVSVQVNDPNASGSIRVNVFGGSNPYNNTQWNNWNTNSGLASTNFKYENQSQSTVNASLTSQAGMADNGSNYAGASVGVPSNVLRYNSYNTSMRLLTLQGLSTSKSYTIQFFGSRANTGNKTVFHCNGQRDTISTDNNQTDHAILYNLSPDNNGRLYIDLYRIGTYNYLAGFIITEAEQSRTSPLISQAQVPAGLLENKMPGYETITLSSYPNPFTNQINITIDNGYSGDYTLQLTGVNGQKHYQKKLNKPEGRITETIVVRDLPRGAYYLQVIMNGKQSTLKLLRQ